MTGVVEGRKPGAAQRLMVRLMMQKAEVLANEAVSDQFRVIRLGGGSLTGTKWRPGDKIQVNQGGFFSARSYTPFSWNAEAGTCELLVWAAGQGPGADWATRVRPGEACDFFPLNPGVMAEAAERIALFGDETSIATAAALAGHHGELHAIIECAGPAACGEVLKGLSVRHDVFRRAPADAHLDAVLVSLATASPAFDRVILTGKAGSIQTVYRSLRMAPLAAKVVAKPYWAAGKTGLS
jgi:ferric-chelate reductase (NADPH)